MKVKLKIGRAGSNPKTVKGKGPSGADMTFMVPEFFTQNPGDVIEVSEAEGLRMIDRGQAEPISRGKGERRKTEASE